jgi:hypothetical protein
LGTGRVGCKFWKAERVVVGARKKQEPPKTPPKNKDIGGRLLPQNRLLLAPPAVPFVSAPNFPINKSRVGIGRLEIEKPFFFVSSFIVSRSMTMMTLSNCSPLLHLFHFPFPFSLSESILLWLVLFFGIFA